MLFFPLSFLWDMDFYLVLSKYTLMRAIKIRIWKPSRCMNWVQNRQISKRKNTPNMSPFPHLETRSLNHLFPGNLKILNLNGHLSWSCTACFFGTSTGINKANLGQCCVSLVTVSENCTGECYVTVKKWNQKHLYYFALAVGCSSKILTSNKRVEACLLAEIIQFCLVRCYLDI